MTDADLADLLRPLAPHLWNEPPFLPGYNGFAAVQGRRGPVMFIITVDHDGQTELSLVIADDKRKGPGPTKPATEAHGRAFLKAWGIEEVVEESVSRRIRHYVVRRGKTQ